MLLNQPAIYLGLFFDDFIYFSESSLVEQHLEAEFVKHVPATFEPEIDFFMGIPFDCTIDNDNSWITI